MRLGLQVVLVRWCVHGMWWAVVLSSCLCSLLARCVLDAACATRAKNTLSYPLTLPLSIHPASTSIHST